MIPCKMLTCARRHEAPILIANEIFQTTSDALSPWFYLRGMLIQATVLKYVLEYHEPSRWILVNVQVRTGRTELEFSSEVVMLSTWPRAAAIGNSKASLYER